VAQHGVVLALVEDVAVDLVGSPRSRAGLRDVADASGGIRHRSGSGC
jgi:hypothetical protein